MLKALDCAHTRKGRDGKELGIIHRDVSPQNVLLSFSGEVKVADFGIAKGSHRSFETITTQVKGKYAYMSPEQALGRQLDARCDLYAVGVMLYELITGKRLHEAPNDLMTLEEVKNSALPNGWGMSVPMGIRPIIRKALKKNIEERYQTAQEFLDDLNKFVVANRLSTHGIEFSVYLKERFKKECDDAISDDGAEKECSMAGVGQRTNVLSIVSGGIQKVSKRWKRCVFTAVPAAIAVAAAFLAVSWLGANKVQDRQPIAPAEQAVPTASAATQQPPVVLLTKKEELPNIPDAPKPIGRAEISEHSAKMELVKKESKSSAVSGTASSSSDAAQSQRSVVSVQAKPWGYVYIPGVVDRRETPVRNVRLDPGEYVVKVNYEPEDKWVQQKIKLAANSRLVCVADFAGRKNMTCKTMP
jgi:serine/threonine protein kinase